MNRNRLAACGMIAVLGLASCNRSSSPTPEVAVAAPEAAPDREEAGTPAAEKKAPGTDPAPPKKEPPPPVFPFPTDAAGRALPKVVAPPAPKSPLATEKFGRVQKPRMVPARISDPEARPRIVHEAPQLLPARPAGLVPTAPAERIPLDLGFGAAAVPARPHLPEAPGIAIRSRDANLPPELAPLARQLSDRASLNDPTAGPGNAAIVTHTPIPAFGIVGFTPVNLPDPFELGRQIKPTLPPKAAPGLAPVVVSPRRAK